LKKNKNIIDAIHEKDLKEFLTNLDLYHEFKQNKLNCKYCNSHINSGNICAIKVKNGQIEFICKGDSCYEEFLIHREIPYFKGNTDVVVFSKDDIKNINFYLHLLK